MVRIMVRRQQRVGLQRRKRIQWTDFAASTTSVVLLGRMEIDTTVFGRRSKCHTTYSYNVFTLSGSEFGRYKFKMYHRRRKYLGSANGHEWHHVQYYLQVFNTVDRSPVLFDAAGQQSP